MRKLIYAYKGTAGQWLWQKEARAERLRGKAQHNAFYGMGAPEALRCLEYIRGEIEAEGKREGASVENIEKEIKRQAMKELGLLDDEVEAMIEDDERL